MFNMQKIARYPGLVLFAVFIVLYIVLEWLGLQNHFLRAVICAAIATMLSPRRKKIQTQTGEKKQITWLFLKKPIIID